MLEPKYNIAIFGHSKSGKSTIGGRLLFEYNAFLKKQFDTFEKEAKSKGKDFNKFNLAYLSRNTAIWQDDKPGDDSRTVFPEFGDIKLDNGQEISIVDTPGHLIWINNIVYSAYLADQALVTISANKGIEKGTLEIFKILNGFNIKVIGILITKMDIVNYSKEVYDRIVEDLQLILKNKYNIELSDLTKNIIPISALSNEGYGIVSNQNIEWYEGSTLKQLLENNYYFKNIESSNDVRFIVEGSKDVYSVPSVGTIVVGTLEFGSLSIGDEMFLEPASYINNELVKYKIKNIQYAKSVSNINDIANLDLVNSRSIISILLSNAKSHILKKYLKRGGIFSLSRASVANDIEVEVDLFEPENIYVGREFVLHSNASYSVAVIKKIINDSNKTVNSNFRLTLAFKTPTCIDADPKYNRLTRFLLRTNNEIIGCGICKKILK